MSRLLSILTIVFAAGCGGAAREEAKPPPKEEVPKVAAKAAGFIPLEKFLDGLPENARPKGSGDKVREDRANEWLGKNAPGKKISVLVVSMRHEMMKWGNGLYSGHVQPKFPPRQGSWVVDLRNERGEQFWYFLDIDADKAQELLDCASPDRNKAQAITGMVSHNWQNQSGPIFFGGGILYVSFSEITICGIKMTSERN